MQEGLELRHTHYTFGMMRGVTGRVVRREKAYSKNDRQLQHHLRQAKQLGWYNSSVGQFARQRVVGTGKLISKLHMAIRTPGEL